MHLLAQAMQSEPLAQEKFVESAYLIALDVQPFKDLRRKISLLAELYGQCGMDPSDASTKVVGSSELIKAPLAAFKSFPAKATALQETMTGENLPARAHKILAASVKLMASKFVDGFVQCDRVQNVVAKEAKRHQPQPSPGARKRRRVMLEESDEESEESDEEPEESDEEPEEDSSMSAAESFVDHMRQRFARSPRQYDTFLLILQVRCAPPMQWRAANLTNASAGICDAAAHLGEHAREHGRATARPP